MAVSGEACHAAFPITSLVVNGTALPVSGDQLCEGFALDQLSLWGMSLLTASAENAVGNGASVVQSFLRSPSFFAKALEHDNDARVEHALLAQLNQEAIDDGDRQDVDDLATVAQMALESGLDPFPAAGAWLGSVTTLCTYEVELDGAVTHGPSAVELTAIQGGLGLAYVIPDILVPLHFTKQSTDFLCLALPATLMATAEMTALSLEGDVLIDLAADGSLSVVLYNADAQISDLDITLPGVLGFLVNWLVDFFESDIAAGMEEQIAQELQGVTEVFQTILAGQTLPETIDLPFGGITLSVASGLDLAEFAPGYGRLGLHGTAGSACTPRSCRPSCCMTIPRPAAARSKPGEQCRTPPRSRHLSAPA